MQIVLYLMSLGLFGIVGLIVSKMVETNQALLVDVMTAGMLLIAGCVCFGSAAVVSAVKSTKSTG